MDWQAMVIEIGRGRMLVQPLDAVRPMWLKIRRCDREYVESELLRLSGIPEDSPTDQPVEVEVLGCSLDPARVDARPPRLEAWDEEEGDYAFTDDVSYEESEPFEHAMELLRAGRASEARRALCKFLARHPLHIDSYHHLGLIASEAAQIERSFKYFEMAYRIGRLGLPPGFAGRLPWGILPNRPFLRACHGRALALMELGRSIEAADGLAEILRLNPGDNQGVRHLLPGLLLEQGALDRARQVFDQIGADGTNLFTLCLIDVEQGRRRDALRWLCAAVAHNPFVPGALLGEDLAGDDDPIDPGYFEIGGRSEALEYARHHGAFWRRGKGEAFLRTVLGIPPFADRLARMLEILQDLDELPVGDERTRLVRERFALFGEDEVSSIVAECIPHLRGARS